MREPFPSSNGVSGRVYQFEGMRRNPQPMRDPQQQLRSSSRYESFERLDGRTSPSPHRYHQQQQYQHPPPDHGRRTSDPMYNERGATRSMGADPYQQRRMRQPQRTSSESPRRDMGRGRSRDSGDEHSMSSSSRTRSSSVPERHMQQHQPRSNPEQRVAYQDGSRGRAMLHHRAGSTQQQQHRIPYRVPPPGEGVRHAAPVRRSYEQSPQSAQRPIAPSRLQQQQHQQPEPRRRSGTPERQRESPGRRNNALERSLPKKDIMLSFGSSPSSHHQPPSKEPRTQLVATATTPRRDPPPHERSQVPERKVVETLVPSSSKGVKPSVALNTKSSLDQATRFLGKTNLPMEASVSNDSRSVASSASSSSSLSRQEVGMVASSAVHLATSVPQETTISKFLANETKREQVKTKPVTQTPEPKVAKRSNVTAWSGYERFNNQRGSLQIGLKDAAVIMSDKKSSVASSSSSASSSLSREELGGIARKALTLSKFAPKKETTISKFLAKDVETDKKPTKPKEKAPANKEVRAMPLSSGVKFTQRANTTPNESRGVSLTSGLKFTQRINTSPAEAAPSSQPKEKSSNTAYSYSSATRLTTQLSRAPLSPAKASLPSALGGPLARSLSPVKARNPKQDSQPSTTLAKPVHMSRATPKVQKAQKKEETSSAKTGGKSEENESMDAKRIRHLNSISKAKASSVFERNQETTFGIRESTKQNQTSIGTNSAPVSSQVVSDVKKTAKPSIESKVDRDSDFVIRPYYSPRRRTNTPKSESVPTNTATSHERSNPEPDSLPEQENDKPEVPNHGSGRQRQTSLKQFVPSNSIASRSSQVRSGVQNKVKASEEKRPLTGTKQPRSTLRKSLERKNYSDPSLGKEESQTQKTTHIQRPASPESPKHNDRLDFLSHLKGNKEAARTSSEIHIRPTRPGSNSRDPGGVYGTDDVSSIVMLAEPPGTFGERRMSPSFTAPSSRRSSREPEQRLSPSHHQSSSFRNGSGQRWGSPRSRSSPSFSRGHHMPVSPTRTPDRRSTEISRDMVDDSVAVAWNAPTGTSPSRNIVAATASPTSDIGASGVDSFKKEVVDETGAQNTQLYRGGENHSRSSANGMSRAGGCTESSDSRPDAFQWLHQKYGNKAPTANVDAIEKAKTKLHTQVLYPSKANGPMQPAPARPEKVGIEDDEDIFFGLDDESLPDAPPELPNNIVCEKKSDEPRRQPPTTNVIEIEKSRASRSVQAQDVSQTAEATKPQDPPDEAKGNMRTFQETIFANTVISDLTTSLITDRAKRSQFFTHNDSIMKTPKTAISDPYTHSLVYEQVSDESTFQDQPCQKPPSVFDDISAAIAQSLKNGTCAVPNNVADRIKDVPTCAMTAKAQCAAKIDEAMDALGRDQDSTNIYPYATGDVGRSGTDTTGTSSVLNDVELRIWQAWDRRRSRPNESTAKPPLYENDLLPELEQSSSSTDSETKAKHYGLRQEAHDALMEHAQKAVAMFGMNSVPSGGASTSDGSSSEMPKPRACVKSPFRNTHSPGSRLSSILSFREQEMLENFSSALKNSGIEVLKLGRRNIWQIRYLTVSKEVTQLPSGNVSGEIGQCPKALLWPKTFKPQNCSVSTIKENGRGGVLFEHLKRIRPCSANEHYDNHLPKKLKQSFPVFAGVVLDYAHDGGDRQLQLCFKSEPEAHAFITAMLIIREANDRGTPFKDEGSAYTTHSNSDSLLD